MSATFLFIDESNENEELLVIFYMYFIAEFHNPMSWLLLNTKYSSKLYANIKTRNFNTTYSNLWAYLEKNYA